MPDLETIRPRLSGAISQTVSDLAGGVAYGGNVEGSTNVAFGGPTADFILYNIVNGAFSQGPPNANDYIDPQNNPMPYWAGPTQVSGGAIQVSWVVDSSSPSGYNMRFTVNPGAASDEAYMEQLIPVGGSRARYSGNAVRAAMLRVTASDNGFQGYVALQYLDVTGAAVGSSTSTTLAWTADGSLQNNVTYAQAPTSSSPVATSALLRIRVGVKRNTAAATASGVFDASDIRSDRASPYVLVAESTTPGSYAAALLAQTGGALILAPNGAAGSTVTINGATNNMAVTLVSGGGVDLQGYIHFIGMAAPSAPALGDVVVYAKGDGHLYTKNDVSTETRLDVGVQAARAAAGGSIAAGGSRTDTITWTTSFVDANYTVALGTQQTSFTAHQITQTLSAVPIAASATIRSVNEDTSARTPTIHAVAVHD